MIRQRFMNHKILIISIESKQLFPYREFLLSQQATLVECTSVIEGMYSIARKPFDLVIINADRVTHDSLDMLANIKQSTTKPVMHFSDRMNAVERMNTLIAGADESLLKSETLQTVKNRLELCLRKPCHSKILSSRRTLQVNDMSLCLNRREIKSQGSILSTTGLEFELLFLLMSNAGNVVSRDSIRDSVFAHSMNPCDTSLNMHISNVRKKLAFVSSLSKIKAVRGVGYVFL